MTNKWTLPGAAIIALAATGAQAADALNAGTGAPLALSSETYTQNFNGLKSVTSDPTTNTTLPAGWQIFESGSSADGAYQFGSASSAVAGAWSYGSGSDRALGGRASLSVPLVRFGALFTNDLGGTIDSLAIAYRGEQWQKGFSRATLQFEYSLDATSIADGTWIAFDDLDFLAPDATAYGGSRFGISSRNGNNAAFRRSVDGTIGGLAIADGGTFALRWTLADISDNSSSDDGLAIDDFSLTASLAPVAAVPEPATWAMLIGGIGAAGGMMRRRRMRTTLRIA